MEDQTCGQLDNLRMFLRRLMVGVSRTFPEIFRNAWPDWAVRRNIGKE